MKRSLLYTPVIFIFPLFVYAQIMEKIPIQKPTKLQGKVFINGTSSLHDWESISTKVIANVTYNPIEFTQIETLEVSITTSSIKSGKKLMDKLTYKALKNEEHPTIKFSFIKSELPKIDKDCIYLSGDLFIAGVTKKINVIAEISEKPNKHILHGSHELLMTDYGIQPPEALMGTIKTGNKITITFDLELPKNTISYK